jgi:hypothetical protein
MILPFFWCCLSLRICQRPAAGASPIINLVPKRPDWSAPLPAEISSPECSSSSSFPYFKSGNLGFMASERPLKSPVKNSLRQHEFSIVGLAISNVGSSADPGSKRKAIFESPGAHQTHPEVPDIPGQWSAMLCCSQRQ